MNILITGDIASFSVCLAQKFSKEGHKVVLAGPDPGILPDKRRRVTFHQIAVDDILFHKTLARYRFDAVVFIGSREECFETAYGLHSGEMLDGLQNALELAKNESTDHFFFISSTEIYGDAPNTDESVEIEPVSVNGYALASAEKVCAFYQDKFGLGVTICRVPQIYSMDPGNGLLFNLVDQFRKKAKVNLPYSQETGISLLHGLDVAEFILMFIEEPAKDALKIYNLSPADPMTISDLTGMLNDRFPSVTVSFDPDGVILARPAQTSKVKAEFGWIPKRTLEKELPGILDALTADPAERINVFQKMGQNIKILRPLVPWVELMLGGAAVLFLNNLTETVLQFRYIDFRLLFVVLLGAVHGTTIGLVAALIASGLTLLSWYQAGMNFSMLLYNIENWIPFALYLLAGGITGYLHDKHENEVRFQEEQVVLIQEKYKFLYGVYDDISTIKDQFRQQLMGYRDSFGRIYNITTQLNSLQEEDVMFRAMGVLEDLLENDAVAIYSLDEDKVFGRLQVCSQMLRASLPKSIRLKDYADLGSFIERGEVYQNKELSPGYPAYFSPVLDGNVPVAGIAIWEANFDQFSLQYLNLIKVITGMIQSALVRASLFKHANAPNLFLPNTRILNPDAFRQVLMAKKEMETSQVAEYEVIRILSDFDDLAEASKKLESGIRTTDYIGMLEDGRCYILLSQTDWMNAFNVLSRLENLGINGEICTEVVFDE